MFGIGMGPSSQETGAFNNLNQASGFATGVGESDTMASSQFMQAILSGDSSKISQVLAPQISQIQKQAGQRKATTGQFSTRGGGTNAAMQSVDDSSRSAVNDLVSSLTGNAASSLASTGSGLLGAGMSGFGTAFNEAQTMQQQRAAKWDDLFKSIGSVAGGVVAGLPGSPGGVQDYTSNILGGMS